MHVAACTDCELRYVWMGSPDPSMAACPVCKCHLHSRRLRGINQLPTVYRAPRTRMLRRAILSLLPDPDACPQCGGRALVRDWGDAGCLNCGWSGGQLQIRVE